MECVVYEEECSVFKYDVYVVILGLFPEMQATSDQDWILLNVNVSGYYRVNYDHSNWERVQNQLMKDPNVSFRAMCFYGKKAGQKQAV